MGVSCLSLDVPAWDPLWTLGVPARGSQSIVSVVSFWTLKVPTWGRVVPFWTLQVPTWGVPFGTLKVPTWGRGVTLWTLKAPAWEGQEGVPLWILWGAILDPWRTQLGGPILELEEGRMASHLGLLRAQSGQPFQNKGESLDPSCDLQVSEWDLPRWNTQGSS